MNQVKVQIVRTEERKALVEGAEGAVVAALRVPEFGGKENFLPGPFRNGAADTGFVGIDRRGVYVAVTGFERLAYGGLRRAVIRNLEGSESGFGKR